MADAWVTLAASWISFGQRAIEIWASLPFLYTIIILSSIVVPVYVPGRNQLLQPSFWLLVFILAAFDWMAMTYYVRGEFYREKAKDYVGAAIVTGVPRVSVMFRHILPNALTPVISFAPFSIVANISTLVALDFLGFRATGANAKLGAASSARA